MLIQSRPENPQDCQFQKSLLIIGRDFGWIQNWITFSVWALNYEMKMQKENEEKNGEKNGERQIGEQRERRRGEQVDWATLDFRQTCPLGTSVWLRSASELATLWCAASKAARHLTVPIDQQAALQWTFFTVKLSRRGHSLFEACEEPNGWSNQIKR